MHASSIKIKDGHTFEINLNVNFNTATIEIEDVETHERWETTFDANFIEELTRKVGNFKKFPVFISMLESAMKEKSSSVFIELLNFSEIGLLKHKKMGLNLLQSSTHSLNARKILILHHIDEFDRTKYPIALNYLGVLDVKILQKKLKTLQLEVATYRNQDFCYSESREIMILKKELEKLEKGKCEIEMAFKEFRQTISKKNARPNESSMLLTNLIDNVEGDLTKEMVKYKKDARRVSLENKALCAEIKKLKATEQRLRGQVQNLKNEITQLKRSKVSSCHNRTSSRSPLVGRSRDSSRESKFSVRSCTSINRLSRCNTSDKPPHRKVRSLSNDPPRRLFASSYSRKPSPSGSLGSRFDPTAYVSEMRRKRLDIQRKRESSLEFKRNKTLSNQKWRSSCYSSPESSCVSYSSNNQRQQVTSTKFREKIKDETESLSSDNEPAMTDVDLRLARLKQFVKELR